MFKIGIFFGSDTGNTKRVAYLIYEKISKYFDISILNIADSSVSDFKNFDILILGTSTWYYGELQYDWDNFLDKFKRLNFLNKRVCFFGCGNQKEYSDYFCNGVYKLYNVVKKGGALVFGYWPTKNYFFNNSISLINKNYFIGLMIDEINQYKFTNKRINIWVSKLIVDIYNFNILK